MFSGMSARVNSLNKFYLNSYSQIYVYLRLYSKLFTSKKKKKKKKKKRIETNIAWKETDSFEKCRRRLIYAFVQNWINSLYIHSGQFADLWYSYNFSTIFFLHTTYSSNTQSAFNVPRVIHSTKRYTLEVTHLARNLLEKASIFFQKIKPKTTPLTPNV